MGLFKVSLPASLLSLTVAIGIAACSSEEEPSAAVAPEPALSSAASTTVAVGGDLANGEMVFQIAACSGCHSQPDDPETGRSGFMAGGDFAPDMFVANITQDVETGIGGWSDAEIESVLRTGVRPDGSKVHGVMPFTMLRVMTEKDMRDLITYLRTVPPVENKVPRSGGDNMPYGADLFSNFPAPPTAAEVGEEIARGAYIASLAHCLGCHTYIDKDGHQDFENLMGAGGMLFDGPEPAVSANITPHMEDGIGAYSVADIVGIFQTGNSPDGTELAPMMGTRGLEHLPQSDLEALAAYLKWLPARPSPVVED